MLSDRMVLNEEISEAVLHKYVKNNQVLSLGTSEHALTFLKKLALKIHEEELQVSLVPTSAKIAVIASSFKLPLVSINENEIDVAIEFADQVNKEFSYIKRETHSLIRDKMIAQSAAELVLIADRENSVSRLHGSVPFEVVPFGWKRSLIQLDQLGHASIRKKKTEFEKTESGNYLVDVKIDASHNIEELSDYSKNIPGVIESGIFVDYADRVLLHNKKITVKSRIR